MSRQLRIEYAGAIYHITSRGNGGQPIVADDQDRRRFFDGLGDVVQKYCWDMYAVVLMTTHFHLFFRTACPNLSNGMQVLLGGYATWFNRRYDRDGHLFQGRFRGHLVEDDSYFWTVSRYVHLNPCPVMVAHPAAWPWSSYPGYVDAARRLPWVSYDSLLAAWRGEFGGDNSSDAYQKFVESGLEHPVSPFAKAIDGWILGAESFADHIRALISPASNEPVAVRSRRSAPLPLGQLTATVCDFFGIDVRELARKGSRHPARTALAWLARQYTDATLEQLAPLLGLAGRDSTKNLILRMKQLLQTDEAAGQIFCLEHHLGVTPQDEAFEWETH